MSDERRFSELFTEMERVGIDPHGFPAGVTVQHELAVKILRVLPDGAGPAAFLTAVREEQQILRANAGLQQAESRD
ncbi:hypothetical protein BH09GEM1_BH09GEM1_28890 [soil metagenome]